MNTTALVSVFKEDVWLHQVLVGKSLGADPRVKPRYIQNVIDINEPDQAKPWEGEISGRLMSLSSDALDFASKTAEKMGGRPAFYLRGFIKIVVSDARLAGFDVIHDPTLIDSAHALLIISKVVYSDVENGGKKTISQDFIRKLSAIISVYGEDDLDDIERDRAILVTGANTPPTPATPDDSTPLP